MSFLAELQGFARKGLRHTETVVETIDGRKLKESHDKYGHTTLTSLPGSYLGFVGDCKPDLQISVATLSDWKDSLELKLKGLCNTLR